MGWLIAVDLPLLITFLIRDVRTLDLFAAKPTTVLIKALNHSEVNFLIASSVIGAGFSIIGRRLSILIIIKNVRVDEQRMAEA